MIGEHIHDNEEKPNLEEMSPLSRRNFIAILGASAAFTAVSCTDYPDKGKIVPYNKKPEEITPGKANFYASTCNACPHSCGVLVKTREGRPIKIDGNPEHPVNQGKICAKGQSNILNMYDPERLKVPQVIRDEKLVNSTWKEVDSTIITALNQAVKDGKEIAVLCNTITSPSFAKLISEFKEKFPTTKIYPYEAFVTDNRNTAWKACYDNIPQFAFKWDKAKVILSLDADILGTEGNHVEQIRQITSKRSADELKSFSRIYSAEAGMSITGMNADYRFRLAPQQQLDLVLTLLVELFPREAAELSLNTVDYSFTKFASVNGLSSENIKQLFSDLRQHAGESIVYAGDKLPGEVHIAVNYLNELLGNTRLYDTESPVVEYISNATVQDFEQLSTNMKNGKVGILLNLNTNPVFHLPEDIGFAGSMSKVRYAISLLENLNETSKLSNIILSGSHFLESWGDYARRAGIYSLQQPQISPLYDTRQKEAVLLSWIRGAYNEQDWHDYIMSNWEKEVYPKVAPAADFKTFWNTSLHDGVTAIAQNKVVFSEFKKDSLKNIRVKYPTQDFTVIFSESFSLGDGHFANNGWLLELPHPVSKVVWDNYASIAPATATELGLTFGDMVEISINNRKQKIPVFLQPGMAEKVATIELGWGRKEICEVGLGAGFPAQSLLSKAGGLTQLIYSGAKIGKAGEKYKLVTTQENHLLDELFVKDLHLRRHIIREGTIEKYQKEPNFIKVEKEKQLSMLKPHEYTGEKWAMAIDLSKCIGCGICVTACNVENNVAVVGKTEVSKGREMHWIRIDRYYSGSNEEPIVSNQPVMCQQCDNAPCENVCPVVATNHSPDGLNQMVYNRCVGTRYCSNNCPYKVRRYNFFDFRDRLADGYYQQDSLSLLHNPEVTVRPRGVMEKCTFCVHKITEARQTASAEGTKFDGSNIVTACQEACPAGAISFGNVNDPESAVSKARENNLGYSLLEELNTNPNVTYIAKLRNINSEDIT
ncbi:MAG: actB [Ignavibacteria bacterium]|nr:actB [Ignavibacteria bacterium]